MLFARLPGELSTVRLLRSGSFPGGRVNKTFTRLLIRAFSDVEKPYFSDSAALTAKSENKKAFQRQRRLGLKPPNHKIKKKRLFNVKDGSDYPTAW